MELNLSTNCLECDGALEKNNHNLLFLGLFILSLLLTTATIVFIVVNKNNNHKKSNKNLLLAKNLYRNICILINLQTKLEEKQIDQILQNVINFDIVEKATNLQNISNNINNIKPQNLYNSSKKVLLNYLLDKEEDVLKLAYLLATEYKQYIYASIMDKFENSTDNWSASFLARFHVNNTNFSANSFIINLQTDIEFYNLWKEGKKS